MKQITQFFLEGESPTLKCTVISLVQSGASRLAYSYINGEESSYFYALYLLWIKFSFIMFENLILA